MLTSALNVLYNFYIPITAILVFSLLVFSKSIKTNVNLTRVNSLVSDGDLNSLVVDSLKFLFLLFLFELLFLALPIHIVEPYLFCS